MADPSLYKYPSPSKGYRNLPPLPDEKAADGKSYLNPHTEILSDSYKNFVDPISNEERGGFDMHIYYFQANQEQSTIALALWERIRREFPELRIYCVWDSRIGPGGHVRNAGAVRCVRALVGHQSGSAERVGASNTDDEERDHTRQAMWMGEKLPLDLSLFKRMKEAREKLERVEVRQEGGTSS